MRWLLVLVLGAALLPSVALADPAKEKFNEKFTFTNVTFSDGTTGDIYAGSKLTGGGNQLTVCNYFSPGGVTYRGQFQSGAFASSDPNAVLQFCLAHFDERIE